MSHGTVRHQAHCKGSYDVGFRNQIRSTRPCQGNAHSMREDYNGETPTTHHSLWQPLAIRSKDIMTMIEMTVRFSRSDVDHLGGDVSSFDRHPMGSLGLGLTLLSGGTLQQQSPSQVNAKCSIPSSFLTAIIVSTDAKDGPCMLHLSFACALLRCAVNVCVREQRKGRSGLQLRCLPCDGNVKRWSF